MSVSAAYFQVYGNSEPGIFSVVIASFVKQIFFNLATCVSDCDEMIHIFLPTSNILGWT